VVLFVTDFRSSSSTQERRRRKRHYHKAFNSCKTYKAQLPTLLGYNVALVASDGMTARIGTSRPIGNGHALEEIDGEPSPPRIARTGRAVQGCLRSRPVSSICFGHFIVFEVNDGDKVAKKRRATISPCREQGGRLHGEGQLSPKGESPGSASLWHTAGSGKSLTMAFYAGK